MSNIDFIAQYVRIENLRDISGIEKDEVEHADAQLISEALTFSSGSHPNYHLIRGRLGKCNSPSPSYPPRTLKFLSYIRHLFVDTFLFQIPNAGSTNIRNELAESIST
jgi:hypothetical protein